MKKVNMKLDSIDDVINFNKVCSELYEGTILADQGRFTIDVKSLMGLFSLNLLEPIKVYIETDNKNEKKNFYNYVKRWEIKE